MICFLTSSISDPFSEHKHLNQENEFVENLHNDLPDRELKAVYVASNPNSFEQTDEYSDITKAMFIDSNFKFKSFDIIDNRNAENARDMIHNADLVILAGGHVPTQNKFFHAIGLKEILRDYNGVLVGTSAGSMNCAINVYAQPEEPGEVNDPNYERFLSGLEITKISLLPHYLEWKDQELDGVQLMRDVTLPDSEGHKFFAVPDGSYLYIKNGKTELHGESYKIKNGSIQRRSGINDVINLT